MSTFSSYFDDEEEYEQYMTWAFGERYQDIEKGMDFLKAWNVLHSSLLELDPHGSISDDVPRMIAFWEEKKS